MFSLAGSQVTMAWKITDSSGSPLSNFPITLTVNPGYQDTTGTVKTLSNVAIPQQVGDADGLNTYLISDDNGDITYSFINTNTNLNGENPPADRNSPHTGKIATQMLIYQGTFANSGARIAANVQITQDSDITEIHWIKSIPDTPTSPSIPSGSNPNAPLLAGHVVGALLWSDEFDDTSTSIKSSNWTARYCGGDPANGGSTCMNNEQQSFQPSAVAQSGTGDLIITATHTPNGAPGPCLHGGGPCTFTSGRLDTQGKKSFKYGYIEARIKTPVGSGNWPAFWMLGDNITSIGWPSSGEIDIMEQWRNITTRTSAANHYRNANGNHQYEYGEITNGPDYALAYHTYGLGWTPDQMSFYVDGVLFFRESRTGSNFCSGPANPSRPDCTANTNIGNPWPYNAPFFLILNNAISDQNNNGNPWGGWATSTMAVDYVRAYALDGYGEVFSR